MATDNSEITRRSSLAALGGIAWLAQPKRAAMSGQRGGIDQLGARLGEQSFVGFRKFFV